MSDFLTALDIATFAMSGVIIILVSLYHMEVYDVMNLIKERFDKENKDERDN